MRGIVSGFRLSATIGGLVVGAAIAPAAAQSGAPAKVAVDQQRQSRYQISQMERSLEGAVEHGATVIRERVQSAMKAQTFITENTENAHVRGFRLEGYGVFFDVEVPALQGTLLWSLKTLDQNDLGLESAIKTIRDHIGASVNSDMNLQQALKRLELQIAPVTLTSGLSGAGLASAGVRQATGAPAAVAEEVKADPILSDPQEAYRAEVQQQIKEAMLDYSGPLSIGAAEWLTVAARRHDDRPLLAPADSDARTVIISIRGADLTAFRANQLSRDEALKRMDVRVF